MQKVAATSKFNKADTTTAFVSHMSDSFSKNVSIKWNRLSIIYIKTPTRYYLLKQIWTNLIRNLYCFCSQWKSSQQCRWSCLSLKDWCGCRRVLLVLLFIQNNGVFRWTSHLQVVKRCWWKVGISAWSRDSVYIQLIILPVEFNIVQIRCLIPVCVHILSTDTWKYFVARFMYSLLIRGNWNSR